MSSQASSPAASLNPSQESNAGDNSSSPNSKNDTSILSQESSQLDLDSSNPSAETERHPKGKRKRTAAKDKAILEEAYNANPKPDKAARLDIVNRVSLNEKEVQIWFQNRRQNDRRKSRPLSPQEIAALRYGGMQVLSSDPISFNGASSTHVPSSSPVQARLLLAATTPPSTSSSIMDRPTERRDQEIEASSPRSEPPPSSSQSNDHGSGSLAHSFSSSVGYLANRWNPGSSFSTPSAVGRHNPDEVQRHELFSSSCPSTISSGPILPPPQSSSKVRLSLSLEGKAELVSSLASPPRVDPPRPSPSALSDGAFPSIRRPSLQRSHSAQPSITLPPISTLTAALNTQSQAQPQAGLPPRLNRGRSRDVHAWEFCCDADNAPREDELTAQAERESSGSAIAAISLLRSTSATASSVLQPNSAKRNASSKGPSRFNDLPRAKKPKLGRALSSVGRLQTNFVNVAKEKPAVEQISEMVSEEKDMDDGKKVKVSMLVSPSENDSDKENWSPGKDGNPQARSISRLMSSRRPLPTAAPKGQANPRRTLGRVLQEHRGPAFLNGSRANTAPALGRRKGAAQVEILEDKENPLTGHSVPDDEVERFMRGEVSPSKKGDMDGVMGLLSLSQGNWR